MEVVDENGKNHTFKKYRVIKISDDTENYKKPEQIKKAVKENKIIRLHQNISYSSIFYFICIRQSLRRNNFLILFMGQKIYKK